MSATTEEAGKKEEAPAEGACGLDLVQRLRDGVDCGAIDLADIMDAADEIARLRAAVEERRSPSRGPDDLVERLRDRAYSFRSPDSLAAEAASEIERLRGAIKDYAFVCKSEEAEIRRLKAVIATLSNSTPPVQQ